jgi:hypothetical protein
VIVGTLVGTAAIAAEGPKLIASKFAAEGKIVQTDMVDGEGFALIYEEKGMGSGNGSDHKMHCFGVMQGATGTIVEQHGYCVETDPDGDQVLWKITPAAHPMAAISVQAGHKALAGAGKYAGISVTVNSTCQVASNPTGYTLNCDLAP